MVEGLDTSIIQYEVSKIPGILETPPGFLRIPGILGDSGDSKGFWGILRDS